MTRPAHLLLEHQRLVERERGLRDNIERANARLESDPEIIEREETLAATSASTST